MVRPEPTSSTRQFSSESTGPPEELGDRGSAETGFDGPDAYAADSQGSGEGPVIIHLGSQCHICVAERGRDAQRPNAFGGRETQRGSEGGRDCRAGQRAKRN